MIPIGRTVWKADKVPEADADAPPHVSADRLDRAAGG
jgi:hypothetical protein